MNTIIDFRQGKLRHRFDKLQGRNELIAKAVGWRSHYFPYILDATAGLGREAFLLAGLGCTVVLFERNPQIAALLKSALIDAQQDPALITTLARMTLIHRCTIDYLHNETLNIVPDVIYCDPMFPTRKKTAKVKKEMQSLQAFVGPDEDSHTLVSLALRKAAKRVVVKMPLSVSPLIEKPSLQFCAKSHRFDVYMLSP